MGSTSFLLFTFLLFTEWTVLSSGATRVPGSLLDIIGKLTASGGSMQRRHVTSIDLQIRKAVTDPFKHWPDAVIPYRIDPHGNYSLQDEMVLEAAMSIWSADTCLEFRPATPSDENYITFTDGDYCWSHIGRKGGQQFVILNKDWCRDLRTVLHEVGHAIGLHHEQNRPDRDQFVEILWNNIDDDKEYNFEKVEDVNTYNAPYDYFSIMHYRKDEFSNARGQNTIHSLNTSGKKMGQLEELSFHDVRTVSLMYKCYAKCGVYIPALACHSGSEGFIGKDCNCFYMETFVSHLIHD